jgi:molybdate transport system substrate-binding protein
MSLKTRFAAFFAVALAAFAPVAGQSARAEETAAKAPVIVFAAASLKNALDEISTSWEQESGQSLKTSYAASSALAKQMEQDAPAEIFISADLDWMNYVEGKNLIKADTRSNLLGNKLVLVAPKSSEVSLELKPGVDLAKALGDGRLAVGNVDSVPAGKYGKAALTTLGAWEGVSNKLAQAESVRAALLLVSRGEAPLGIVYQSDAAADASVKIVATFPADSHPAIIYPIALTVKASPAAASFLHYVKSLKAIPAFEKQGFTVLDGKKEKRS